MCFEQRVMFFWLISVLSKLCVQLNVCWENGPFASSCLTVSQSLCMMLWSASVFEKKKGGGEGDCCWQPNSRASFHPCFLKLILLSAGCKCTHSVRSAGGSGVLMTVNWRLKQSNSGRKSSIVCLWDLFAGSFQMMHRVGKFGGHLTAERFNCLIVLDSSSCDQTNHRGGKDWSFSIRLLESSQLKSLQSSFHVMWSCFCRGTFQQKKMKRKQQKYFCHGFHPVKLGYLFIGVNTNWCGKGMTFKCSGNEENL